MANTLQQAKITGYATFLPVSAGAKARIYEEAFEQNRHRVYALAFWMTDNEMTAEQLMHNVFCRAFAASNAPSPEAIDRALVAEIREIMPLGNLTVEEGLCTEAPSVRQNILRVHLERAVVQLPATERMIFLMHDVEGYNHARIGQYLGLSEDDSRRGLHQGRLRLRSLLAGMVA